MTPAASLRGTSLLELLVVLVLLGLMAALSAGTVASGRGMPASSDDSVVTEARRRAVRTGLPVRIRVDTGWMLFLPDGQARGQGLDPLEGTRESVDVRH